MTTPKLGDPYSHERERPRKKRVSIETAKEPHALLLMGARPVSY